MKTGEVVIRSCSAALRLPVYLYMATRERQERRVSLSSSDGGFGMISCIQIFRFILPDSASSPLSNAELLAFVAVRIEKAD